MGSNIQMFFMTVGVGVVAIGIVFVGVWLIGVIRGQW